MTLEENLTQEITTLFQKQREICGWNPSRYLQSIGKKGPVQFIKSMLSKQQPSETLEILAEQNRLDLSLESLIVNPKYGSLFTDDEVNFCFTALCQYGYYG